MRLDNVNRAATSSPNNLNVYCNTFAQPSFVVTSLSSLRSLACFPSSSSSILRLVCDNNHHSKRFFVLRWPSTCHDLGLSCRRTLFMQSRWESVCLNCICPQNSCQKLMLTYICRAIWSYPGCWVVGSSPSRYLLFEIGSSDWIGYTGPCLQMARQRQSPEDGEWQGVAKSATVEDAEKLDQENPSRSVSS